MRVLVTGATGAVGYQTVRQLLALRGHHTILATDLAPWSDWGFKSYHHANYIQQDLTKPGAVGWLMANIDFVINTAALVDISASAEKLNPINTDVVRRLAIAVQSSNRCQGIVHISTASLYDFSQPCSYCDEDSPVKPGNDYERSKNKAEAILCANPNATILRPALIYGPRCKALGAAVATIPKLLEPFAIQKRTIRLVGGPSCNWAHAEDVARAAVFCLENRECWGQTFNVAEDIVLPFGEVVNKTIKASGLIPTFPVHLPPREILSLLEPVIDQKIIFDTLNQGLAWMAEKFDFAHLPLKPKVDREVTPFLARDVVFSNGRLKAKGFKYQHDIRYDTESTIRWYERHNWI